MKKSPKFRFFIHPVFSFLVIDYRNHKEPDAREEDYKEIVSVFCIHFFGSKFLKNVCALCRLKIEWWAGASAWPLSHHELAATHFTSETFQQNFIYCIPFKKCIDNLSFWGSFLTLKIYMDFKKCVAN